MDQGFSRGLGQHLRFPAHGQGTAGVGVSGGKVPGTQPYAASRRGGSLPAPNSNHRQPVFENRLGRDFTVDAPDHVYAGDITYLWTQQGWLYLAVVIDLYSRKVVGWSMGRRLTSTLVCDALQMALWSRRPPKGQLIHHSDRGVQYASRAFRKLLNSHGINGSMSRKGDCWDNAVVESFFGSLKSERVHWRNYRTREEARSDIFEYITMFYNSKRLHSYLDYQSPDDFEKNGQLANAA